MKLYVSDASHVITEVPTSKVQVQLSAELTRVTFPDNFHVHDALRRGMVFGTFGIGSDNNASPALESSLGNDGAATSWFSDILFVELVI